MFANTEISTSVETIIETPIVETVTASEDRANSVPPKRSHQRVYRIREMNPGDTISPVGDWKRTISFSDIRAFMLCQGSYLMYVEGDKPAKRSVSETVGRVVHAEVAKPKEERSKDVARLLKSVPAEERDAVVARVKELIAKTSAAQDEVEANSNDMRKEPEPLVMYDEYTDTYWYAKPDEMAISRDERGSFLLIVDNKTTRSRHWSHFQASFFFGLVARGAKALNFSGPIKVAVRYMRDMRGEILETPHLESAFIGRTLTTFQDQKLQGIQATIKKIDEAWATGSFQLRSGGHCKGCPFRETCPKNREWLEERRMEREARELDVIREAREQEQALLVANNEADCSQAA